MPKILMSGGLQSMFRRQAKRILGRGVYALSKFLNGPHVTGVAVHANDLSLLVSAEDMAVGRHLRWRGEYGRDELELLSEIVTRDMDCLFIGTHVGAIALPASILSRSATLVEANPDTFSYLEANIKLNNIANVVAYNFAAGESAGTIRFIKNVRNSGGSKREPINRQEMYYRDGGEIVDVPMFALDDALSGRKYGLIFMDIEGSEYFALKGMTRILAEAQFLVVEFVPHHLRNVSNVTVSEFVEQISEYFNFLYIPSTNQVATKHTFVEVLQDLYDRDVADDGVVFSVEPFK